MSGKFTISEFKELNDSFLEMNEPQDLAQLLKVNYTELIKLTKKPFYKIFRSEKYKGKRRIIAEPHYRLKQVQNNLNSYLQAVYFFNKPDCVHGFIKSPENHKQKYSILSNAKPQFRSVPVSTAIAEASAAVSTIL